MNISPEIKQKTKQTQDNIIKYTNLYKHQIVAETKLEKLTAIRNIVQYIYNNDEESIIKHPQIMEDQQLCDIITQIIAKLKSPPQGEIKIQQNNIKKVQKVQKAQIIAPKQQKPINKGSIFGGIFSFMKKTPDPNVHHMILPTQQQKYKYDPIKKTYVFEGQEEEVVEKIPKPPSKKLIPQSSSSIKSKPKSEVDSMTAPPSFKRKGKSGGGSKQQVSSQKQIITYETLLLKIQSQFERLIQIMSISKQQGSISSINNIHDKQLTKQMINKIEQYELLWNSVNDFSNDAYKQLQKQIDGNNIRKWNLSKQIKQLQESSNLYTQIFEKLQAAPLRAQNNIQLKTQIHSQQGIKQNQQQKVNQLQQYIGQLKRQINIDQQQSTNTKHEKQKLSTQNHQLITQINRLNYRNNKLQSELQNLAKIFNITPNELTQKLTSFKNQLNSYKIQLKNTKNDIEELNEQYQNVIKLCMIQQQLKTNRNQDDLLEEFHQAYIGEQQLIEKVREKRILLHQQQAIQLYHNNPQINISSEQLLELSALNTNIVKNYTAKIKLLKNICLDWQDKYNSLKSSINRNKVNLNSEQTALTRSYNKLKALLQTYKTSHQQSQNRATSIELENEKLRKQLMHLKQENMFNKNLLEQTVKLKQSNEENISILKEQYDELNETFNGAQQQLQQKTLLLEQQEKQLQDKQKQLQKLTRMHKQQQRSLKQQIYELEAALQGANNIQMQWQTQYQQLQVKHQNIVNQYKNCEKNYKGQHKILMKKNQALIKNSDDFNKKLKKIEQKYEEVVENENTLKGSLQKQAQINKQNKLIIQELKAQLQSQHKNNINLQQSITILRSNQNQFKDQWMLQKQQTQSRILSLLTSLQNSTIQQQTLKQGLNQYQILINNIYKQFQSKKNEVQKSQQMNELLINMQQQINQIKQELSKTIQQSTQKQIQLQNEIEKLINSKNNIQTQLIKTQQQHQTLLDSKNMKINELQQSLAQSNKDKINLLEQLKKLKDMNNQMKHSILKYKDNQKQLQEQRNTLLQTVVILQSKLEQIKNEQVVIENNQQQKNQEQHQNQTKIQQLQILTIQLQTSLQNSQRQIEQLLRKNNSLNINSQNYLIQLNNNSQLLTQLQNQNQKLFKNIQDLEMNVKVLENQKNLLEIDLNKKKSNERQKSNNITNKQQIQQPNNNQLEQIIMNQVQQINQLTQNKNTLYNNIQQLTKDISNKNILISQLETKINQIINNNPSNNNNQLNQQQSTKQLTKEILLKQQQLINKKNKIEILKQQHLNNIRSLQSELSVLKQTNQQLLKKQKRAEQKIIQFQKQLTMFRKDNKKLVDVNKLLEIQNVELVAEKGDLLRINQKLMDNQDKRISMISKQNKTNQQPKKQQQRIKKQVEKPVTVNKAAGGGFLGSISSLFLTPTEAEKIGTKK